MISNDGRTLKARGTTGLPVVHIDKAATRALDIIELERDGKQRGLLCRFEKLNRAMLKYWRFSTVNLLAGASGSGKSYFLNMLHDDFTNPELNQNYIGETPMIIHFNYEMDEADEVIRNLSGKVGKSYSYLKSAEMNRTSLTYNTVTDEEFDLVKMHVAKLRTRPIFYVGATGNRDQMYDTVYMFKDKYPKSSLVLSIDHSLLIRKLMEKDDLDLIAELAKDCIDYRDDFDAMVIPLCQLNANIESPIRRDNPSLHFPIKSDIHGSNQLFWACDNVDIIHRPELLSIEKYGKALIPTKNLVHYGHIKSRFGKTGNVWFTAKLAEGKFEDKELTGHA